MINCKTNICNGTNRVIIQTDYTNYNITGMECALSHYANKFNVDIKCPCIECIVKPICTNACKEKYKMIDELYNIIYRKHNVSIFEY